MRTRYLLAPIVIAAGIAMNGCGSQPVAHQVSSIKAPTPRATEPTDAKKQPRRMVKVAMDAEASKISATAQDATIEDIVKQKAPAGTLGGRVGPFETTQWRVKATLKSVQLMKDGDYYLVMKGDKGGESVVEVPDPAQCKGSPLEGQISAARKEIEDKYHPTTQVKPLNDPATVTGVGFLGWGKTGKNGGKGRSGPRLMPGTDFKFGS